MQINLTREALLSALTAPNAPVVMLNNRDAATLMGVSPGTLPIWRMQGRGPKFYKIGKLVRYRSDEVLAWMAEQACQNTIQGNAREADQRQGA